MNQMDEVVRAESLRLSDVLPVRTRLGEQFVDLLRRADPSLSGAPVPTMTWTVGETAAHMLNITQRGLGDMRRADSLDGLAELNDLCIEETTERSLPALADMLESALAKSRAVLSKFSDEQAAAAEFPLHVGVLADVPTALSYAMFDLIGHGFDIGRATGAEWRIAPEDAGVTMRLCFPALGPWIKEDVHAGEKQSAEFALGPEVALQLTAGEGSWNVQEIEPSADLGQVDPVELFLAVAGRVEASDPEVARIAAWFSPI